MAGDHQSSDKIDDSLQDVGDHIGQKFRTKKKILSQITAKESAYAGSLRRTRPWH